MYRVVFKGWPLVCPPDETWDAPPKSHTATGLDNDDTDHHDDRGLHTPKNEYGTTYPLLRILASNGAGVNAR